LFKPILDRVLCRDTSTYKTFDSAGLEIPEPLRVPSFEAEVLAVGDGVYMAGLKIPMPLAVGDIIKYNPYGADFQVDDQDSWTQGAQFMIRVADVRGIKQPEKTETVQ